MGIGVRDSNPKKLVKLVNKLFCIVKKKRLKSWKVVEVSFQYVTSKQSKKGLSAKYTYSSLMPSHPLLKLKHLPLQRFLFCTFCLVEKKSTSSLFLGEKVTHDALEV